MIYYKYLYHSPCSRLHLGWPVQTDMLVMSSDLFEHKNRRRKIFYVYLVNENCLERFWSPKVSKETIIFLRLLKQLNWLINQSLGQIIISLKLRFKCNKRNDQITKFYIGEFVITIAKLQMFLYSFYKWKLNMNIFICLVKLLFLQAWELLHLFRLLISKTTWLRVWIHMKSNTNSRKKIAATLHLFTF